MVMNSLTMFGLELISRYSESRHRDKLVDQNICCFILMAEPFINVIFDPCLQLSVLGLSRQFKFSFQPFSKVKIIYFRLYECPF